MSKKALVLLNGCGHRDGSEIHEAVFAMEAVEEYFDEFQITSPEGYLAGVVNHCTGKEVDGASRNILQETARISRGRSKLLKDCPPQEFEALIIPGGFGVARNLCNFARAGAGMEVLPEVSGLISSFHRSRKPIGLICIAPILAARVLGSFQPLLTLGDSLDEEKIVEGWGAKTEKCPKGGFIRDTKNLLFSTPAYMYGDSRLQEVRSGIRLMVAEVRKYCGGEGQ